MSSTRPSPRTRTSPRRTAHPSTRTRRDVILDAALAEFLDHGVAGASIDRIRARAKASIGSIYHHFDGKEGIADALFNEALAAYQAGLLSTLDAAPDARAGIEGGVRYHLAWVTSNPDRARFLLAERRAQPEQNRVFFRSVEEWLAPYRQAGELRDLHPDILYALWIGPSQELARQWLEGRVRRPPTEAADVLASAAWHALSKEKKA